MYDFSEFRSQFKFAAMKSLLWPGFKHVMSVSVTGHMNYSPDIIVTSRNLHLFNLKKHVVETYRIWDGTREPDLQMELLPTRHGGVRMAGDDNSAVFIAKDVVLKATDTSWKQLKFPRSLGQPVSVDVGPKSIAVACSIQGICQSVAVFGPAGLLETTIPICSAYLPNSVRMDPALRSLYVTSGSTVHEYDYHGSLLHAYGAGVLSGGLSSIDLDNSGNLFVLDSQTRCIHVFDRMGALLGTSGSEFQTPTAMKVCGPIVYVLDVGARCIQVFQKLL